MIDADALLARVRARRTDNTPAPRVEQARLLADLIGPALMSEPGDHIS